MARLMQLLVAVVAVFVGLAFHVRNSGSVTLDFYVQRFDVPLSLVAVAALILGALLGVLAMAWRVFLLKREISRLRRGAALLAPASTAAIVPVQHGP